MRFILYAAGTLHASELAESARASAGSSWRPCATCRNSRCRRRRRTGRRRRRPVARDARAPVRGCHRRHPTSAARRSPMRTAAVLRPPRRSSTRPRPSPRPSRSEPDATSAPRPCSGAAVRVGAGCLVNRSCSIAHHVVLGDHATTGPGVVVAGSCRIDDGAFLGTGAVLAPEVHVGEGAVVGAGAVVLSDVEPRTVVVGNPRPAAAPDAEARIEPSSARATIGGMPLELVIGPANSAKAGEVLGAYAAVAPRGAVLVVPTSVDADHYRRELAGRGRRVRLGADVRGSGARDRAAHRLRRGDGLRAPARPDPACGAWRGCRSPRSRDSSRAPGFRVAAGELIAELQRALITPQRFVAALRSWAAQDERRAPYAEDLGAIYLEYVRELDRRGRVDRELYAWRALDSLRAAPAALGARRGRSSTASTSSPRSSATRSRRCRGSAGVDVTVSLTYEPGRPALQARAEAVQELTPLAERIRELPALDEHYAPAARAALHHLERSLFEPGAERIDPGRRRRAARGRRRARRGGADRRRGARAAARRRARLARSPSSRRSLPAAAPLIESVFGQYGIAVRRARELPLSHTPLGRALRGAARAALLDERRRAPRTCSTYLRAPGLLARPEVADRSRRGQARGRAHRRQARERVRRELDRSRLACARRARRARRGRRSRPASCAVSAGACSPRRTARSAPLLGGADALDAARARGARPRALDELEQLGLAPAGPELVELLDELMVAPRARGGAGRGPAGRAARDPRPALSGRVRVRPPGGRVPAAGAARAVPVRRAPA